MFRNFRMVIELQKQYLRQQQNKNSTSLRKVKMTVKELQC